MTEFASGTRGFGSYPEEWGMPEGSLHSERRAAWVKRKVTEHRRITAPVAAMQELARRNAALAASLRVLELKRRMEGPR